MTSALSEADRRVAEHFQAILLDLILACLDERGRRRPPPKTALRRAINTLPKGKVPPCDC